MKCLHPQLPSSVLFFFLYVFSTNSSGIYQWSLIKILTSSDSPYLEAQMGLASSSIPCQLSCSSSQFIHSSSIYLFCSVIFILSEQSTFQYFCLLATHFYIQSIFIHYLFVVNSIILLK